MTTRRTFVHTFKNGNTCTLVLDFDEKPKADAKWARTVASEWPQIEQEYKAWRNETFNQYMDDLTFDQKNMVVEKLGYGKN